MDRHRCFARSDLDRERRVFTGEGGGGKPAKCRVEFVLAEREKGGSQSSSLRGPLLRSVAIGEEKTALGPEEAGETRVLPTLPAKRVWCAYRDRLDRGRSTTTTIT